MREPISPEIERIASIIAFWHGQKVIYYKDGPHTVASMHGYGDLPSGRDRYMSRHWEEYTAAAIQIVKFIGTKKRKSKGFRRFVRQMKSSEAERQARG